MGAGVGCSMSRLSEVFFLQGRQTARGCVEFDHPWFQQGLCKLTKMMPVVLLINETCFGICCGPHEEVMLLRVIAFAPNCLM